MTTPDSNAKTERVLIHAPFGRDGSMISETLHRSGIDGIVCRDMNGFFIEVVGGAGALIIGDEALGRHAVQRLAHILEAQPHWSDLPVLIMTSGGEVTDASQFRLKLVEPLGNVTLLERPLRIVTLLSAVKTALRARRRQYQICDILRERDSLLEQAQDSERIYRGIGESIDFGIWICTPDGRNLYASESFLNLVGFTQEQCSDFGWSTVLHPDDAEDAMASWKLCVANGACWDHTHRVRGCDGQWHYVLARGVPIRNEAGDTLCWAGINLDIGRHKEVERALHESNQALRRSNADLEQFAYAASHDLQEPLRNVAIFTQLLRDHYSHQFDAQAAEFITIIVAAAKRMELLIKDLLAYTRATSLEEDTHSCTDAQAVIDRLLDDLQPLIKSTRASITCDPLPEVRIHEVHLLQLFQNLLSNAIKYRSEEPPRVHISATCDSQWTFSVEDNGIGLDPKYAGQIFGIFKRLHNSDQYPGTGIGLAICQKIVERYGGRIWVESEVGKGAAFHFTLPF
jgi:PAS domain S-box-containing protein